ncbi:MAG: hypothetical protein ACK4NF_04325 [Planctomycetota bacterium]
MEKNKGFVIMLALFIVVTLLLIGLYFIGITRLGASSSSFYQQDILVNFSKDSVINIGYSKLLYTLQSYGFFLPYENEVLFTGEDLNFNGKLDEEEEIINNGIIDTLLGGSLDLYSKVKLSVSGNPYTFGKLSVKPSYIIEKNNLTVAVFLKIIDASSKFNIKNSSNQIIKNVSNYLQIAGGEEFLKSLSHETRTNEHGWFERVSVKNSVLYNLFTVYSYVDTKVIKNAKYSELENKKIFSILEVYPKSIDLDTYSPVNINTANFDVLYNLFLGLKGYYFKPNYTPDEEFPQIDKYHNKKQEDTSIGTLEVVEITNILAKKLAESILSLRKIKGAIKDFTEIEEYLRQHDFEKNVIDLIIANCKSTFHSYKYNVHYFDDKSVDRYQLIEPTTTISFFPTGSFEFYYDVFVISKFSSRVQYNFSDYAVVKLYDIKTHTLNSDFKDIKISRVDKTVSGYALDIYPQVEDEIDYVYGAYLGSALSKIYNEQEIKDKASFYLDLSGKLHLSIADGEKKIVLSHKNFPKSGKLFGENLHELGNIFSDGTYFDNYSSLSFPIKGNFPAPGKLELYDYLMKIYRLSYLAEIYDLAQLYATPIKTIGNCISSYLKVNRFLSEYKKPRIFFSIFLPVTKDYYSYIYFFSFLYPELDGRTIKPSVFVTRQERAGKEIFINYGDTAGLAQIFGMKKDSKKTLLDGNWHNIAFCLSNTGFKDIKKSLDELEVFDVKLFRLKDWGYGPAYYKKLLDILNVSAQSTKIYIDGEELTESITFPSDVKNLVSSFLNIWDGQSFSIGGSSRSPVWNYPLDSSLSHFTIWKKNLSDEEINTFLKANKYYDEKFYIEFDNKYSAVYMSIYSRNDILIDCSGCEHFKRESSYIFLRKTSMDGDLFKISFAQKKEIPNNFIMIDNITLFRILPLSVFK